MDNINVTIIEDDKLDVTVDTGITLYGTFDIASTETGLPGTEANVENISTANNAILKFTIPQGIKGEAGEQGSKGEKGDTGIGIPTGGTTGQVLAKVNGEDYNTEWVDQTGGGGTSNYNVLTNKPQINGVTLTGNKTLDSLGIQAKGSYLTEETDPTVPTWAKEENKPSYTYGEITGTPSLSNVATSGDYEDLSNKPVLADVAISGSYNDLENKPYLSVVATSGNYNDLSYTPTSLPANGGNADTVNNIHIISLTQEEYDALVTKDASTLYLIIE